MSETLRVLGDRLGEDTAFIDAEVSQIELDGSVELVSVDDTKTWTCELTELQTWQDNNYAAQHSDLAAPSHSIWDSIDNTYEDSFDSVHAAAEYEVKQCSKSLFEKVVTAQTS